MREIVVLSGFAHAQGGEAGVGEPLAPPPPRSIDVRVWVTRPHIAVLEFPLSPRSSALLLEGEQGVYYRWQSLIIAQVRGFAYILRSINTSKYAVYRCGYIWRRDNICTLLVHTPSPDKTGTLLF